MQQRGEVWCLYTVQGAADEDEEEPNAFQVVSSQRGQSPSLGDLMRSFARSRPIGDRGERWHWRVRVLDESHGHAWMDVTDESVRFELESLGPESYAVYVKLLDTSPRACTLRLSHCTLRQKYKSKRKDAEFYDADTGSSTSPREAYAQDLDPDCPTGPPVRAPYRADGANFGGRPWSDNDDELDYASSHGPPQQAYFNDDGPNFVGAPSNDGVDSRSEVPQPQEEPSRDNIATGFFYSEHDATNQATANSLSPSLQAHLDIDDEPALSPAEERARMQRAIDDRKQNLADTISDNQMQAKEEMRRRKEQQEEEEKECDRLRQTLGPKLKDWSEEFGRKKNIRALLAGMDKVMWPEAQWKSISIADLLEPSKVKKSYYKASRFVHPDKLVGLSVEQRFIGKTVFDALTQAMADFEESGHK